jgi:hypothetical protein
LLKNKKIKIHHVQTLPIKEIRAEEAKQGVNKEMMIEINRRKEVKTAIKIKRREERIRTTSNKIKSLLNQKLSLLQHLKLWKKLQRVRLLVMVGPIFLVPSEI